LQKKETVDFVRFPGLTTIKKGNQRQQTFPGLTKTKKETVIFDFLKSYVEKFF
jgi:hypothetical protein